MNNKIKKYIALAIVIIIAVVSFAGISKKASAPESYEKTIQALDNSQDTVTGLTMTGIGASTALAAIPGEATTPMANKVMDVTGYLFAILCVITLEKYMLTLTGALVFKIMIPAACILLALYICTHRTNLKALAARFLIFSILLYVLVPTSVYVSTLISDTYEQSREYSVEKMEEEFTKIEKNAEGKDKNFWEKFKNTVSTKGSELLTKAENTINNFIEYVAVLMVINIGIPIITVFLFLWLTKMFFGLSGPVRLPRFSASAHIHSKKGKLKETKAIKSPGAEI